MIGAGLESQIELFLARLERDQDCDAASLLESIRCAYVDARPANVLSSQVISRLYALASLSLAGRRPDEALRLLKIAMTLSPHDTGYSVLYDAIVGALRDRPARPVILVISCEKYAARGIAQADRLRELERVDCRIVIGEDAQFPDDPRVLRVSAPDNYEGLPGKVAAALVEVFERHGPGSTALKLDDDVPVIDPLRLQATLETLTKGGIQYTGRPLEGPDLDRIWHWGKCSSPEINARIYGGYHHGTWAGGTAYFLGARALRAFALATHRFPDLARNAIYEDRLVGDVLSMSGETLRPALLSDWGLALPDDVEDPNLDAGLWKRLNKAWHERAAAASGR